MLGVFAYYDDNAVKTKHKAAYDYIKLEAQSWEVLWNLHADNPNDDVNPGALQAVWKDWNIRHMDRVLTFAQKWLIE